MIFKPVLIAKILSGEKRQTRRRWHVGDTSLGIHYLAHVQPPVYYVYSGKGTLRYAVGNSYAVQPGRCMKAVARFKLLGITYEYAYDITREDAIAEGFGHWKTPEIGFLDTWTSFYDPRAQKGMMVIMATNHGQDRILSLVRFYLKNRPAHLYREWALKFEVTS